MGETRRRRFPLDSLGIALRVEWLGDGCLRASSPLAARHYNRTITIAPFDRRKDLLERSRRTLRQEARFRARQANHRQAVR